MADINAYIPDDVNTSLDQDPIAFENKASYIWGIYMKIRTLHYQSNEYKIRYKMIASTWFLAAFIAYDLLLSDPNIGMIIDKFFGVFILGFVAAFAITLTSVLDIGVTLKRSEVYRRLCLQLEDSYDFLTKTFHNMDLLLPRSKKNFLEALFYAILVFVLLFISNIALHIFLVKEGIPLVYLYSSLMFVVNCGVSVLLLWYSKKVR